MTLDVSQRIHALSRLVAVLSAWEVRDELSVTGWSIRLGDTPEAAIAHGDSWTPTIDDRPAVFHVSFRLPREVEDAQLDLDLGGEGDVRVVVDGRLAASGGLNPYHRRFPLGTLREGQVLDVTVEVVARSFFGRPTPRPALNEARLVRIERELHDFLLDLRVFAEVSAVLKEHDVAPHLLGAAEEAIGRVAWPSDTRGVLSRGVPAIGEWYATGIWRLPPFPSPAPLSDEARAALPGARAHLSAELDRLRPLYPPIGRIAASGHAHLDLAWLWPVHETRRKLRRTFRTVLALMDEYEAFTFNQSSAQVYAWLEEDEPELFERVKARVLEGRIETVGGSWVEPDGQMPSGESWARQLLYGQRYFQAKFGRRSRVLWLPDTFGYTPALPQILKLAGIGGFFTTKLSWSETNRFPHDLFAWEGIDGTRVTAHMFHNPGSSGDATGGYNGEFKARDLHGTWANFRGKNARAWRTAPPSTLFSYGYGDGGGGPSREHLERFARLRDFPAMPRLAHSRVDDFFEGLPKEGLPVWVGELYLELHRATLTTQGRVKKLHREAEHRLREAEVAASAAWLRGRPYPRERLERSWKTLLLNEFHDILPGSSIKEVYDTALPELQGVVDEARAIAREAGGGDVSLSAATLAVVHEAPRGPASVTEIGDGFTLSNDFLTIEVAPDGTLRSVVERASGREALRGDGNVLMAYVDVPREWEAWDTSTKVGDDGEEVRGGESVRVVEDGPGEVAVEVARSWRSSRIVQTYRLGASSKRLDVETFLDWHERRVLLRALFDLDVHASFATFETAFGAVSRPTHRNTSWDAARFEVCGHRWADVSQPDFGVALLNDGKYGHSVLGSTLGLSLVRGAMFPDVLADEGEHRFRYALYPHSGSARDGRVAHEASDFNGERLRMPAAPSLRLLNDSVLVSALKKAEEGDALILRVYEPYGANATLALEAPRLRRAARVNLLEEPLEDVAVEPSGLTLALKPFEIVSLHLEFEENKLA
ncbi:alpha-mannosidase [Deinococcus yavapaiensis]|uniref:Alpha-mannosidase n=1 Tax=Deinococcus yavapaiensis KR-236 TaxID=694435 RepID=A0A318SLJ6_9DEIO|nr:glycoside hydrolase family 38 C-terminal domain-containing protein [Deinococcus yavapaiensis]PYE55399.1 alpha-mannosidase [Deinococcus yavapaiensis KR-236]